MNQKKTGEFLKSLRKEKGLTQEQLAEHFYVSPRTVSRWETGSNMPSLDMLIELADFYDADIREIIEGERKSESMDNETKDTLKKVAEYADAENRKMKNKMVDMMAGAGILLVFSSVLFENETKGLLYGVIPESACNNMIMFSQGLAIAALGLNIMYLLGIFDKIKKIKSRFENRKG
ncbi:MAG: helix-turn-helix domain-containing protein [Oscillospiraceae bacterium]|nr:helix-turn-helix domain-containing protein [Oscillospiraceae bacterium]